MRGRISLLIPYITETSSTDERQEAHRSDDTHLFSQLERLAEAVVLTIGEPLCEMVIHDFREP